MVSNFIFQHLGHTFSFDGNIMDTIQHAQDVLNNPMIGKLMLEYYEMVETELCNHVIATVQNSRSSSS